jgi:Ca2+-binding RTX toxin-like protein
MAIINFGTGFAVDMSDPTPDYLISALSGASGVQLLSQSSSQISVNLSPIGTKLILTGSFNFSSNAAFLNSSVSGVIINNSSDQLVFSITGIPTITFDRLLSLSASQIEDLAGSVSVQINGTGFGDHLIGGPASDLLYGNGGADLLTDGAGNDFLSGGIGDDTMRGGAGNDTYVIDSLGDVIVELPGQGTDMVVSPFEDYVLPDNFENLGLDGAVIRGMGNAGNNLIVGNFMNNIIDGGAGNDTLMGMSGNDTYYVDSSGDVVSENAPDGDDIIYSTASSFTMGANVETLVLLGGAVGGTGNAQDNDLVGNSADNVLSGGAGNDVLMGGQGYDLMTGGTGDDTYYVNRGDGAGIGRLAPFEDQVVEAVNAGTDTVYSSMYTYSLDANVENLVLEGMGRKGFGNALNNAMTGDDLNNTLDGGAGNDTLNGGTGVDRLTGGAGNDSFAFDNLEDVDRVLDFNVLDDTIQLSLAVFTGIGSVGNFDTNAFVANFGAIAGGSGDHILYDTNTGALYYDADGNGAGTAVQFALISGAPALTAADIAVIA